MDSFKLGSLLLAISFLLGALSTITANTLISKVTGMPNVSFSSISAFESSLQSYISYLIETAYIYYLIISSMLTIAFLSGLIGMILFALGSLKRNMYLAGITAIMSFLLGISLLSIATLAGLGLNLLILSSLHHNYAVQVLLGSYGAFGIIGYFAYIFTGNFLVAIDFLRKKFIMSGVIVLLGSIIQILNIHLLLTSFGRYVETGILIVEFIAYLWIIYTKEKKTLLTHYP